MLYKEYIIVQIETLFDPYLTQYCKLMASILNGISARNYENRKLFIFPSLFELRVYFETTHFGAYICIAATIYQHK